MKEYSSEQYYKDFLSSLDVREKALERALDIRKFEIDLYWKRATYFWTLIAATFAGFFVIQRSSVSNDMSFVLASLGLVFSFGWHCVNRGSKFWQENWESHVDMLEDPIIGPLYKVTIKRRPPSGLKKRVRHLLSGPSQISVSRVNQLTSVFVILIWVGLLCYSLPPFLFSVPGDCWYAACIVLTVATCIGFFYLGSSNTSESTTGNYSHRARKRAVILTDSFN